MEDRISFLFDVLKRYDHYIGTTNFKVGLTMSFLLTLILGLTLRLVMIGSGSDVNSFIHWLLLLAVMLTIATSLIAIFKIFNVVFPSLRSTSKCDSLIFFGDVSKNSGGPNGYCEKIKNSTDEALLKDLACQTFFVAEIVTEKFRLLQSAINIVKFGVIPLLAISLALILIIR